MEYEFKQMENLLILVPMPITIIIIVVTFLLMLWLDNKMYYFKYDFDNNKRKQLAIDNYIIQIIIALLCGALYYLINQ